MIAIRPEDMWQYQYISRSPKRDGYKSIPPITITAETMVRAIFAQPGYEPGDVIELVGPDRTTTELWGFACTTTDGTIEVRRVMKEWFEHWHDGPKKPSPLTRRVPESVTDTADAAEAAKKMATIMVGDIKVETDIPGLIQLVDMSWTIERQKLAPFFDANVPMNARYGPPRLFIKVRAYMIGEDCALAKMVYPIGNCEPVYLEDCVFRICTGASYAEGRGCLISLVDGAANRGNMWTGEIKMEFNCTITAMKGTRLPDYIDVDEEGE